MKKALGFVETRGLVAAIFAADAMLKTADINLVGKEIIDPGVVLVKITGDPLSVQFAVEAGAAAADRLGLLISSHIISEPDEQLSILLPELFEEIAIAFTETKEITSEVSSLPKPEQDRSKKGEKKNEEASLVSETASKEKAAKEDTSGSLDGSKIKNNKPSKKTITKTLAPDENKKNIPPETPIIEPVNILPGSEDQPAIPVVERKEIKNIKPDLLSDDNTRANHALVKEHQNPIDHITDEIIAPVEETSKQIRKAKTKKELTGSATLFDSVNDTIARLKREALGVTDQTPELSEIKPANQEQDAPSTIIKPEEIADDLLSLNVHLLRKRARSIEGFPIHGREISKANREQLLDYFQLKIKN